MANYADANDMTARYSAGLLGDLVSDDGARVPASALSYNNQMVVALRTATGYVKAHLRQADRYTDDVLEGISDSGSAYYDAESAEMLADITCRIAFWHLWKRKPWSDTHESARKQAEDDYKTTLDMLRKGTIVLDDGASPEAGKPESIGIKSTQLKTMWSQIGRGRWYPNNKNVS
jgi:phage gp36-like protein